LRKAKGDHQKKLNNLTQAETKLLRSRILKDEMGIDSLHATKDEVEKANAELEKRVHRRGGFTQKGTREWKETKKEKKKKKEVKQTARRERRGWKPKDLANPAAMGWGRRNSGVHSYFGVQLREVHLHRTIHVHR
jgi:hypothetical protein